jgi:hypothetical protein
MFCLEADDIATVADHDVGIERQSSKKLSAERGYRTGRADDERARGADADNVVLAQLSCQDTRTKRPVSADIDAAKKDDKSDTPSTPVGQILLRSGRSGESPSRRFCLVWKLRIRQHAE